MILFSLPCFRVGLSAGKGLGAATALINPPSNQNAAAGVLNDLDDEQDAGQGQPQGHHHGNQDNLAEPNDDEARNDNVTEGQGHSSGSSYSLRSRSGQSSSQQCSSSTRSETRQRRDSNQGSEGLHNDDNRPSCSSDEGHRSQGVSMETKSCQRSDGKLVSGRGKSLVTKKGLVCKVKSRKNIEKIENNSLGESSVDQESTEKGKVSYVVLLG